MNKNLQIDNKTNVLATIISATGTLGTTIAAVKTNKKYLKIILYIIAVIGFIFTLINAIVALEPEGEEDYEDEDIASEWEECTCENTCTCNTASNGCEACYMDK